MTKTVADVRSLARAHTEFAIKTLAGIAQNGTTESAKVSACQALLDRGWGKPAQPVEGGERPIELIQKIERVIVRPKDQNG